MWARTLNPGENSSRHHQIQLQTVKVTLSCVGRYLTVQALCLAVSEGAFPVGFYGSCRFSCILKD